MRIPGRTTFDRRRNPLFRTGPGRKRNAGKKCRDIRRLGFATLFGSFVFRNQGIEKWARRFSLANAVMTPVIAVVYFDPTFSIPLLFLGSPWIVTASGSMHCLSFYFNCVGAQLLQTSHLVYLSPASALLPDRRLSA